LSLAERAFNVTPDALSVARDQHVDSDRQRQRTLTLKQAVTDRADHPVPYPDTIRLMCAD